MHNKKMFDLENKGQRNGVTSRNGSIRCQISTSIKVILEHFSLALAMFKVFKLGDLENVNQLHDVQHMQWR